MRWQRQRRSKNVIDATTPKGFRKQGMDTDALFNSRLLSKAPASRMKPDIEDNIMNVIRTHDVWPSGRHTTVRDSTKPQKLDRNPKKSRLKKNPK